MLSRPPRRAGWNGHDQIATLEITEVQEELSKARVLGDAAMDIKVGDIVELANSKRAVAIMPLVDLRGRETTLSRRLSEQLTTGLVKRDMQVVERRLLNRVLGELALQNANPFDRSFAQKIGKELPAYGLIMGTIAERKNHFVAQIRFVKVETGEILFSTQHTMRNEESTPLSRPAISVPCYVFTPAAKPAPALSACTSIRLA